jgi:anti-repressor protein
MSTPTSNVIPFKFKSIEVRVIDQNGEPMFIAKDVADLLGYANTSEAIQDHCKNVKLIGGSELLVSSDYKACRAAGYSHNQSVTQYQIIPERDVYRLIMRSKMPEAEKFEDWVVGEVLPSIRKTGTYQSQQNMPKSFAESLRLAADLAEKLEAAQPKIAFAEAVNDSINSVCIRDFAKSVGTGQNKLFAMLREGSYVMDSFSQRNRPYQKYVDQGLFKLQEKTRKDQNGEIQLWFKTLITAKGQMYFQNKFFSKVA